MGSTLDLYFQVLPDMQDELVDAVKVAEDFGVYQSRSLKTLDMASTKSSSGMK